MMKSCRLPSWFVLTSTIAVIYLVYYCIARSEILSLVSWAIDMGNQVVSHAQSLLKQPGAGEKLELVWADETSQVLLRQPSESEVEVTEYAQLSCIQSILVVTRVFS